MRTSEFSPSLHAAANAPLFAAHNVYLGAGIVGGSLMAIDDLSRRTADVAVRLLNGAPPKSIKEPLQLRGEPIFDGRELERWGIPESRLPAGSVVRYRTPSLWRAYRGMVLGAAGVLAIQSLLIVGLLYQRRARQRAESDSRRNLALAVDASRRQTMSALTSSIGHELGQPLGSIMHNAQALQMLITADRATADTTAEILFDIQTQGLRATQIIDRHRAMLRGHELDKKRINLGHVISESLAFVAHDLEARQVKATVRSVLDPVCHQRRPGAPAASAREPGDERHGRDGRDAGGPASRHDQQRGQGHRRRHRRCATMDRACRRMFSTRCSRHSSRRKRTASGSA